MSRDTHALQVLRHCADAGMRHTAAAVLRSYLSPEALRTIGTRLDFATASTLRAWGLIPARKG